MANDTFVTIRMKSEDIARMDKAAKEDERTRSSWLRKLVLDALRASDKPLDRRGTM
jgi:hypothetical protein